MNIVFLLGNGFDINLGMKTGYKDFYKNAYKPQAGDSELIKKLKKKIENDIETWADLETKLGLYTEELKNREEFFYVFNDIREKLAAYISQQDDLFLDKASYKNKFLENMRFPYNFLTDGEKEIFTRFIKGFTFSSISVNAISFNYTRSLEKIIDYNGEKIKIENVGNTPSHFFKIEHIHGFTDNRFVLGVDRVEQIANESFRTDGDILDSFIKPRSNAAAQHLCDNRCKKLIDNAQVICTFGMSIGETDRTWWEYIGNKIGNGSARLIIFWFSEKTISPQFPDVELRAKNSVKEQFLSMTSFTKSSKEKISPLIHIAYNSEIFGLK